MARGNKVCHAFGLDELDELYNLMNFMNIAYFYKKAKNILP